MHDLFKGLATALITPFNLDGSINIQDFCNLFDMQLQQGVSNFILFGSTGEGLSITSQERNEIFHAARQQQAKAGLTRVRLIVTASHPSTNATLQQVKQAVELGADAILATTPCYTKPTQQGLYEHFIAVADEAKIPVILYNNPGRTITEISLENVMNLSKHNSIIGLKDSTNNLTRTITLRGSLSAREKEFIILAGDDENAVMINLNGGNGCVSVASNVIPTLCNKVQELCAAGKFADAAAEHAKLMPLYKALQCDSNPVPIKYAAFRAGFISSPMMRLPLVPLPEGRRPIIDHALDALLDLPPTNKNTVTEHSYIDRSSSFEMHRKRLLNQDKREND
ncbi:MAG: 4-hydroxy-tetrahydrodipicolinate synthase [Proteobacteria bacterium]|nr:4-hydroxy-tetrahydrodipicolinate synthase [Pseudomonadota bacterium]